MLRWCPWLVVSSLLVACSNGAPPANTSPEGVARGDEARAQGEGATPQLEAEASAQPGGRMEGGFFVAEGAPSPTACAAASDCVGDTRPAPGGCCNAHHPIVPHSRAYSSWVSSWRSAHCGDVTCPPPPAPSRPPDCHFALRCEAGACRDACGD